MAARNAREGVKKIGCDDSDGSSGAESVDVAYTRLLLREVGSNSKVPNESLIGSHTVTVTVTVTHVRCWSLIASCFIGSGSYQPSQTVPPLT